MKKSYFCISSLVLLFTFSAFAKAKVEIVNRLLVSERLLTCTANKSEKVSKKDRNVFAEIRLNYPRKKWELVEKIIIDDKANGDQYTILPNERKTTAHSGWYEYERDLKKKNDIYSYFPLNDRDLLLAFPVERFKLKNKKTQFKVTVYGVGKTLLESGWVDADFTNVAGDGDLPQFNAKRTGSTVNLNIQNSGSKELEVYVEWGNDPNKKLKNKEFTTSKNGNEIKVNIGTARYFSVIVGDASKNAEKTYIESFDRVTGCEKLNRDPREGKYSIKRDIFPDENPNEFAKMTDKEHQMHRDALRKKRNK